ncbi:uncharacterized protein LOC108246218 [Kryptolebias marmoratus]|uniref:uncharacterized protein LOC108246218 n=1 Tax=Kryptolebias marmoratus TaxID=37003 RepID=UPI0007F93C2F|nr:uncharacterized protein LOC108246218 [Kryptolebias marmoratus]
MPKFVMSRKPEQICPKVAFFSCFIYYLQKLILLFFSTEKRGFKKRLSPEEVKDFADQLANVKNTESFPPEMPLIQPKTELEEQEVLAVQVKVEDMETPIEPPEKCQQVLMSAVKQEEAEQEIGPTHQKPKQGRKSTGSEGEESFIRKRNTEWSEEQSQKASPEDHSSLDDLWENTEQEAEAMETEDQNVRFTSFETGFCGKPLNK